MSGLTSTLLSGKRVAYLSGPAPVELFYNEMRENASSYFGVNYMKQFLQLIEDHDGVADIVAWNDTGNFNKRLGRFFVYNRVLPQSSGVLYHIAMMMWHIRVLARWLVYRPHVVVLTGNQNYWWIMYPLHVFGSKLIPSYHTTLWPKLERRKVIEKLYNHLNLNLILRRSIAIVTTSKDISDQVFTLAGGSDTTAKIIEHLPTYQMSQFSDIKPVKELNWRPFSVIFTGRIETNKGVFDLLDAAYRLNEEESGSYRFHLCGDGSQSGLLYQEIQRLSMTSFVTYHGYCGRERIKEIMSSAHVVVVPTRSNFEAGFEMTCCEAVMCGRPLIASRACPALHYLDGAAIAIDPDSPVEIAQAIKRLSKNRPLFEDIFGGCDEASKKFFNQENSWTCAMTKALKRLAH